MKKMRIQDLKAHLSTAVAEAEAGSTIVITRHNQPVAQLTAIRSPHVRYGSKVGTPLKPAIEKGLDIDVVALLNEDRGDR